MQVRSPDQEANDASRGDAWRKRRQEALADAYAYDLPLWHTNAALRSTKRSDATDDGYEEVES